MNHTNTTPNDSNSTSSASSLILNNIHTALHILDTCNTSTATATAARSLRTFLHSLIPSSSDSNIAVNVVELQANIVLFLDSLNNNPNNNHHHLNDKNGGGNDHSNENSNDVINHKQTTNNNSSGSNLYYEEVEDVRYTRSEASEIMSPEDLVTSSSSHNNYPNSSIIDINNPFNLENQVKKKSNSNSNSRLKSNSRVLEEDDEVMSSDEVMSPEEEVDYHKYPDQDEYDTDTNLEQQELNFDENENIINSEKVLGPLGGTNTTGVVLEGHQQPDDDAFGKGDDGDDNKQEKKDEEDAYVGVSLFQRSIEVAAAALSPWRYLSTGAGDGADGNNAHATDLKDEEIDLIYRVCSHLIDTTNINKSNVNVFNGREVPIRPDWRGFKDDGYTAILVSETELDHMNRFLEATRPELNKYLDEEDGGDNTSDFEKPHDNNSSTKPQSYEEEYSESELDEADLSPESSDTHRSDEEQQIVHIKSVFEERMKTEDTQFECFQLPIMFSPRKTGFEESNDLILFPGMLVANRYLVQEELGSAAFSTTYQCMDLTENEVSYCPFSIYG